MGGTELLIALLCWVDWLPHVAKTVRGENETCKAACSREADPGTHTMTL